MRSFLQRRIFSAALTCALIGFTGAALAQDKDAVIKDRQATMKGQGKSLGDVKGYLDGKNELPQAQTGAADLTRTIKTIPDLFPPGTGGPSPSGDFAAKPEIWTDWNKFLDAQKAALERADALLVAVKSGDKAAIQTAFADLGKNGCGNCHTNFREKLKN